MRFSIFTLGCKVNQYESLEMEKTLIVRGHTKAAPDEGCDVCIINTCAVTAESTRKSRQAVRRLKKREPNALIAVCGCYTQLEPGAAGELGVDIIGGSEGKEKFAIKIERLFNSNKTETKLNEFITEERHNSKQSTNREKDNDSRLDLDRVTKWQIDDISNRRTRALLKIQDGCDNFCAYCVIPFARGRSSSVPLEILSKKALLIKRAGYKEIIITGIEISSYGKDLKSNGLTLIDAVSVIAGAAPDLRLRIGSLDPGKMCDKMIEKLREIPDLCPHFHLSLQSGCDSTLLRMGRHYNTEHVLNTIASLRRNFKDCFIASDLIVGFPGETDGEFEKTLSFIKEADFSAMHIFPFSSRAGTRAAAMAGQVTKQCRQERAAVATDLAKVMSTRFKQNQIGKTTEVLFEQTQEGFWSGYSSNYLEIRALNGGARNMRCEVKLVKIENDAVYGNILAVI